MARSAVVDTFVLGNFSFDVNGAPDKQGWISVDATAQTPVFHVDDFSGMAGPYVPLEGQRSAWAGIRDAVGEFCAYATLPGYGNNFVQRLQSRNFPVLGDVLLTYKARWDSEPAYDQTVVDYENKDGQWSTLYAANAGRGLFDFQGQLTETLIIPGADLDSDVRIRFSSYSDGAFSDEDGLWPTNGHFVVDSIVVVDATGTVDFEDFEDEPVGALVTQDGDWTATTPQSYGDFAALFPGVSLLQEDPCVGNLSAMWAFINGSTETYACGGHPEQIAVPKGIPGQYGQGLYMMNEIWSPPMDWATDMNGAPIPATASATHLEFDAYKDLPIENLVFLTWHVRSLFAGCGSRWETDNFVHYSDTPGWFRERFDLGPYISPGLDQVQVKLRAWDTCPFWCGVFGSGECHSHAPMFDNVRVVRVQTNGPEWLVQDFDTFQDNFAGDGTKSGTVRIDIAKDTAMSGDPVVRPGDVAAVTVWETNFGIDFEQTGVPTSGPAVYCHVRDVSPAKAGASVSDDVTRWPVVSAAGGWTVLRFDTLFMTNGEAIENRYGVDLNDNLYTPGDTIYYYFSARDGSGRVTYWSRSSGVTDDEAAARAIPNEVTCLPANGLSGATDILYVDDYDGYGAQIFFDSAFDLLGLKPDRYDVLAPSTNQGNGPASRVTDVQLQLASCYRKIIWNSGSLPVGLIGDGDEAVDKSDDYGLLFDFLDLGLMGSGVYISGDNIAEEWSSLTTASPTNLRNTYANFNLVGGDHALLGESLSPLVIGAAASCFSHDGAPDTMVAFAECPPVGFDVLQPLGLATLEMAYSNNSSHGAVITQLTPNAVGDTARVVLSGFSYHHIRDDRPQFPVDRIDHLLDVIRWLDNDVPDPTGIPVAVAARLEQNTPNPFNPSTRIRYTLTESGRVTLRIYNVAGQLVRSVVDEVQHPTPNGFEVVWDGRSDSGDGVSSGVYFYRIVAPGLLETRKMVLLK